MFLEDSKSVRNFLESSLIFLIFWLLSCLSVISLDISKAFDRVSHKGLLAKLPMFGLHQTFIAWIASFLSDRSIAIRVDGYLSKPHSVNSGVSQGSVISPVLTILFIYDLLSSTTSRIFSLLMTII